MGPSVFGTVRDPRADDLAARLAVVAGEVVPLAQSGFAEREAAAVLTLPAPFPPLAPAGPLSLLRPPGPEPSVVVYRCFGLRGLRVLEQTYPPRR
jgi:hypothetical protein